MSNESYVCNSLGLNFSIIKSYLQVMNKLSSESDLYQINSENPLLVKVLFDSITNSILNPYYNCLPDIQNPKKPLILYTKI